MVLNQTTGGSPSPCRVDPGVSTIEASIVIRHALINKPFSILSVELELAIFDETDPHSIVDKRSARMVLHDQEEDSQDDENSYRFKVYLN